MKPIHKIILCCCAGIILCGQPVSALHDEKPLTEGRTVPLLGNYEFRLRAGFNIGGSAPLDFPAQIREICSYNPTMAFSIEGNVTRNINPRWGIQTGLRFETKGMKTDARVRNYMMRLSQGGQTIQGLFTGNVITKVKDEYLTIPLMMVYNLNKRWDLKFGGYASFLLNGSFSGIAYDGYIRDRVPTNPKMEISEAPYDFSEEIKRFDVGLALGADYMIYKRFSVYADLMWGFNSLFPDTFTAISFKMYNIYLNMGFSYLF